MNPWKIRYAFIFLAAGWHLNRSIVCRLDGKWLFCGIRMTSRGFFIWRRLSNSKPKTCKYVNTNTSLRVLQTGRIVKVKLRAEQHCLFNVASTVGLWISPCINQAIIETSISSYQMQLMNPTSLKLHKT